MAGESNGCKHKPSPAVRHLSVDELVGGKVQQRRTALGIARADLAQRVGVTELQLEAFESGKARANPRVLGAIAKALDVSVMWLFLSDDDAD